MAPVSTIHPCNNTNIVLTFYLSKHRTWKRIQACWLLGVQNVWGRLLYPRLGALICLSEVLGPDHMRNYSGVFCKPSKSDPRRFAQWSKRLRFKWRPLCVPFLTYSKFALCFLTWKSGYDKLITCFIRNLFKWGGGLLFGKLNLFPLVTEFQDISLSFFKEECDLTRSDKKRITKNVSQLWKIK